MLLCDIFENTEKAQLIAKRRKLRAKRMNPKATKTNQMVSSGGNPSDVEAGMGSTEYGSRYHGSAAGVN